MASQSVTKLARAAESSRRALSNMRAKTRAKQAYALSQGEVVLGGVAGGLIDGVMGEGGEPAEVFGLPTVAVLGGVMTVAGFSDMPGAEHAGFTGVGLLAFSLGKVTEDAVASE